MSFLKKVQQTLVVWLIKKIQKYGPRRVQVLGNTYFISEHVFNPKYYYTSQFMARHIEVAPGERVLDIGTGSGIQAITAGKTAERVLAVDINAEAVRYATKNAEVNGLADRITVIQGDLFSPITKERDFDVILFTPPYLQGAPDGCFDHALYDQDSRLLKRFFSDAREFIAPNGYVQMVYSSIADTEKVMDITRQYGWSHELVAREKTAMEEFFIFRFRLKGQSRG